MINGKIIPYFQPKIDLRTNKIMGAEVFLRAVDVDGNFIQYPLIMKYFSAFGLYNLDLILLDECFKFVESFNGIQPEIIYSLNLPICDPGELHSYFVKAQSLLEKYPRVQKSQLEFELLETDALKPEIIEVLIESNRDFSFQFCLDDFGVAHSNLEKFFYLQKIISCIKVDRFLVHNVENPLVKNFFTFIVGVSRDLGLCTIAEGVETKEQHEFIKAAGVDYGQGFYYYPPLPPFPMFQLLNQQLVSPDTVSQS